jgi:hypothetical protein
VEKAGTTYFLVDAGASDVDVSVDVFLEQTKNEAAAGLVFQASDSRHMQRFLLQAKGPAVEVRIDSVVEGECKQEECWLIPTMKRGLTLRVVAKGGDVLYSLDGKEIKHLQRTYSPSATLVGLVNGGGESSRFDNAGDAYEIAWLDGCLALNGANARAVLYGVFELEDVIAEHGGVPADLARRAKPSMKLRLLHPRVQGGFHGYRKSDFEFLAHCGGNVAHLTHDWMREKTLFSYISSTEFPKAEDTKALERNRARLRQYLDWCKLYGLDAAMWLCEIPCQGGPWTPEPVRKAFLDRFPAECLSDTGTYQGKLPCLAHPRVEQEYRRMMRLFLTDFPGVSMLLVFTADGFFDQWGTMAEYMQCNAVALRELVLHPENAAPDICDTWAQSLAARRFGPVAAPQVLAAWKEIEVARLIQSDHTYYWHHLRSAWSGPVRRSPLIVEALKTATLGGGEPPKPHGQREYSPYRDDIARAQALAPALKEAAGHFGKALAHLQAALPLVRDDARSTLSRGSSLRWRCGTFVGEGPPDVAAMAGHARRPRGGPSEDESRPRAERAVGRFIGGRGLSLQSGEKTRGESGPDPRHAARDRRFAGQLAVGRRVGSGREAAAVLLQRQGSPSIRFPRASTECRIRAVARPPVAPLLRREYRRDNVGEAKTVTSYAWGFG